MINKILLNNEEFELSVGELPILIHGADKAGASLFTISLATDLYSRGHKIVFLCGYPMAKEEFINQVGNVDEERAVFYTKDFALDFIGKINSLPSDDKTVMFVKNIELFDDTVFDIVLNKENIILSGDVNLCVSKDKILGKSYKAKILFSELENHDIPELEKYQGFMISEKEKGFVSLKKME